LESGYAILTVVPVAIERPKKYSQIHHLSDLKQTNLVVFISLPEEFESGIARLDGKVIEINTIHLTMPNSRELCVVKNILHVIFNGSE